MEPQAILYAHPLDLLFENRNKSYGAYTLRKYYSQRLFLSLAIIISGVGLAVFFYLHYPAGPMMTTRLIAIPDQFLADIKPTAKPDLPVIKPHASRPAATTLLTPPLIVKDQPVPQPMATVDNLKDADIGLKTTAGEPGQGQPDGNLNDAGMLNSGTDSADLKGEIFDRAEQMPEFPGGPDALKRFLLKNLRMPPNELESGTQVRVIARFVVGSDGRVRDIQIVQAGEPEFNLEVKRVISKMPDWKPGMQNHRTVAVYFNLPVNFVAQE